ncbi:MAG: phage holin family protein [Patescibacteria group bacterium]
MTFIHWLITAVAILIAAYLIPGVSVTLVGALVLAIVLGIINMFFKPIITLLTLPINILTLGIFSLVVNALLIMLSAIIVPDFSVDGFWTALLFSIVVSLVTAFLGMMVRK